MPFAVVNGEPISELPKDLYIPPQALEVFLEAFEGPMDLLLYMIRRQNLDILDIPIADITKQYMDYIGLMQDMQLELAGEYLVMTATPGSAAPSSASASPRARCRRWPCRKCCWHFATWCCARKCSRIITFNVN